MADKRAPKSEAKLFYLPPGGGMQYTFSSIISVNFCKKNSKKAWSQYNASLNTLACKQKQSSVVWQMTLNVTGGGLHSTEQMF